MSGTVAVFHLHDDDTYLEAAIASVKERVPVLAFVNKRPWYGEIGDWQRAAETAKRSGAEVIVGEWQDEAEHRIHSMNACLGRGIRKVIVQDGDEVIEAELLDHIMRIVEANLADRVRVRFDTYWKSPEYVVRPAEYIRPIMLIDPSVVTHRWVRDFEGGRLLVLEEEFGKVHHLSYVGPDQRIKRKLETWSHRDDVIDNWWTKVWKAWDDNRCLTHLHPTHPDAYGFAERIEVPTALESAHQKYLELTRAERKEIPVSARWPSVSVVIPVHEQADLLDGCLSSLESSRDLIAETIIVDNGSISDVESVAQSFDGVKFLRNDSNLGFARASNQGAEAASGEVVLFLNNDTIVPRSSLIRLIEPLTLSATLAATGPLSNNCGGFQRTFATYTDSSRAILFAEDFTAPDRDPIEVDMLVGFCLAVRKCALDEVGLFDERFGLGMFEDNDLSYRLRRSGWRLILVPNAFVHHEGSKTLANVVRDTERLFRENERKFVEKWRNDIETGFASHLSGLSSERIDFDVDRKPETRSKEIARKRDLADISLCMIVRDEERVLAKCLKSAKPFFKEMIIVDTGSTDSTIEIAKSFGAEVRTMEWPDSFAMARNESLRGANGRWIFWMDADDTLPRNCGEAILDVAINASENVHGFIVPVQFVEEGPSAGTRVDHVKLFRNLPSVVFEGRIHEQILGTLRARGGQIARCDAHVLHSGYDTSQEGQLKKRVRDEKLLKLDLQDRPDHPFVLFNLGMTAHYTNGHREAVEWLNQCLSVSSPNESHVRKAYALKAVSQRELGDLDSALQTLHNGIEAVGDDPELHFHAGLMYSQLNRFDESLLHYQKVRASDVFSCFTSLDIGILGFKLHHNTAGVLCALDRYDDARKEYLRALELAPQFLPSAFELFDQAVMRGDMLTAKTAMEHVRVQDGECENWMRMLLKYVESNGGTDAVDGAFQDMITNNRHAQKAYAGWLLKNDRIADASRYWKALQQDGDAESAYLLGIQQTRAGNLRQALAWMRRANELNPSHDETANQVIALEQAIAAEEVV